MFWVADLSISEFLYFFLWWKIILGSVLRLSSLYIAHIFKCLSYTILQSEEIVDQWLSPLQYLMYPWYNKFPSYLSPQVSMKNTTQLRLKRGIIKVGVVKFLDLTLVPLPLRAIDHGSNVRQKTLKSWALLPPSTSWQPKIEIISIPKNF